MKPESDASDLEAVLAPIPGNHPTGVDLRQDTSPKSIYFRLRDARAEARDAERQADIDGDESVPKRWRPVAALALEALKGSAKDLEVATWLTEALVRTEGLPGLSTGAAIIAGLVERYWDDLFPLPDEDGMETRVAALAGLSGQGYDGTLMQPLRKAVLFRRPDGSPFGLWQYEASLELSGIVDLHAAPSGSRPVSCPSPRSRRRRAWPARAIGPRSAGWSPGRWNPGRDGAHAR